MNPIPKLISAESPKSAGHTLTEVLVVLLLLTTLVIALPSPSFDTDKQRVARSGTMIANLLSEQIGKARLLNTEHRLVFRQDSNAIFSLNDRNGTLSSPRQRYVIPSHLKLKDVSFGQLFLSAQTFSAWPSGAVTPGHFTITTSTGKACTISISLYGSTRKQCNF